LYLHVSLARFKKSKESEKKDAVLLRLRVVIKLILTDYKSYTTKILFGILLKHLTEYPEQEYDLIAFKLTEYEKKGTGIDIVVLNWLGWLSGILI
jgi:hypothetical protein